MRREGEPNINMNINSLVQWLLQYSNSSVAVATGGWWKPKHQVQISFELRQWIVYRKELCWNAFKGKSAKWFCSWEFLLKISRWESAGEILLFNINRFLSQCQFSQISQKGWKKDCEAGRQTQPHSRQQDTAK